MKTALFLLCMMVCFLPPMVPWTPAQEASSPEERSAAQQLLESADELFGARRYDQAGEIYKLAAQAAEREMVQGIQIEALSQVARCHLIQGRKEEGRSWLVQAEKLATPQMPKAWSRYLGVRGRFEWRDDHLETATKTFEQMYDYCLQHELHERAVDAAHMVAITGPHEEQILWAQKGIEAAEKGNIEGWLGPLWNNLGWTYEEMGRYQESLDALLKARDYHWKLGSEYNKLVADWSVGHAHRKLEQLDEAEIWLRPVLSWAERIYASDPSPEAAEWVGHSCRELGEVAIVRGELGEGLALLHRAQAKLGEANMPEWDPDDYGKLSERIEEISQQIPAERLWHTVVHFEIPFDDQSRATSFYRELLGWEIVEVPEMDYWMAHTVPTDEQGMPMEAGINGGFMKREAPGHAIIDYISVESVDEYLGKAKVLGGKVIMPKTAIPGMGWFAHLADTEGNMFGIIEEDPGAK